MSLYSPEELLTVGQFFQQKFGRDAPEPHEVNAWRLAETKMMMSSAPFAITNYFKVADKEGDLVRIKPFVGQAILSVCLESQRRRNLRQRVIEVKPRQVGWTTWCIGEALHTALQPNKKAMILVNDEDIAGDKAAILASMVNSLPLHFQPMRRIQNLKHIVFDNPNPKERIYNPGLNAQIQITVPSGMRGSTPHLAVISEYAHMDDDRKEEVNTGLLSAMGLRKASCVLIDTTANGYDDSYYPRVVRALEMNPKWVRRIEQAVELTAEQVFAGEVGEPENPGKGFVPAISFWFQHDEYVTKNVSPRGEWPRISKVELAEMVADIGNNRYGGEEERDFAEMGISPYRLYWRRKKIDDMEEGSQEMRLLVFRQEFPSTALGAFVNYERSPFDRECLAAVVKQGREPVARGILRKEEGRIGLDTTFHSDWQELRVYAGPQVGSEQYSIGVDTGGIRYGSLDADAWVAQVLRARDFKVVATYEARVDEFTFCDQLMMLYEWYGYPYTTVELQASGYAVMRRLIDAGMRNYYQWKRLDVDFPQPGNTVYPGWETTGKTRPIMDDRLVEVICHRDPMTGRPEPLVIVPDIKTLSELQSVKRTTSGAIKNDNGHDDCVDALILSIIGATDAWSGINRNPKEPKPVKPVSNFEALGPRRWRSQGAIAAERRSRNNPDLANI